MENLLFVSPFEHQIGDRDIWCCYTHFYPVDGVIWVGHCRLVEVFDAPDARKNSEWIKRYQSDRSLKIGIVSLHNTPYAMHDAANAMFPIYKQFKPHCNLHGHLMSGASTVYCVETGVTYESASAACKAFNIANSNMSQHLNNPGSYAKVKGLTFKRGSPPIKEE